MAELQKVIGVLTRPARRSLLIGVVAAVALSACKREEKPILVEAPAAPPAAPVVKLKLEELPTPLPLPYDDAAPTEKILAELDAAFARAKAADKRVIVNFGGNWCSWCRMLESVMHLPEVKPFMDANFEVVHVGVGTVKGQMDQRPEVRARFNLAKIEGTPWLVVAEPDGKVLASSFEVTDDKHETPQAMVEWLAQWAKRGTNA